MITKQHLGRIKADKGCLDAMWCVDIDQPEESTLHFWGPGTEPMAVRLRIRQRADQTFLLTPLALYKTNAVGGLYLPVLTEGEKQLVRAYSGVIREKGNLLLGEWHDGSGRTGSIQLSSVSTTHAIQPYHCTTWAEYRNWTSHVRKDLNAIQFRGHGSNQFRLMTTLHRAGLHRIERYCMETLQTFKAHAESLLNQRFDLNDAEDYAIILGLAQHHGLPTPLLDWTRSPYIAAFFAFADAIESAPIPNATHVRVYGLTAEFTARLFTPKVTLPYYKPYLAPLTISARGNRRLYAQQGQFVATNIADVEGFILTMEARFGTTFMVAADVPISCAAEAFQDLEYMGLSAASLFPGLDGVCRMMRHTMLSRKRSVVPSGMLSEQQGPSIVSPSHGNQLDEK